MTAREVKDALRRRHPAVGAGSIPGEWTVLEEWMGIDLLAWSAWGSSDFARIGYEVKVSRKDLRRELLDPAKRWRAVDVCSQFYLAVPAGLMKPEEKAWEESPWDDGDFEPVPCPENCRKRSRGERLLDPYAPRSGTVSVDRVPVPVTLEPYPSWVERMVEPTRSRERERYVEHALRQGGTTVRTCPACGGKGIVRGSRVMREAPHLWVPRDVGLVEIDGRGVREVRKAPVTDPAPLSAQTVAQLVRWVSVRPDPRHAHLKTPED